MEINEDPPNEKRQRLFIQSQGVSHRHLDLAQTPRKAEEWSSFTVEERKRVCALIGGYGHEEVTGRLTGCKASEVTG